MRKIFVLGITLLLTHSAFSQFNKHKIVRICHRDYANNKWSEPHDCKKVSYYITERDGYLKISSDSATLFTYKFIGELPHFDNIDRFYFTQDRMIKGKDENNKDLYVFYVSNNTEDYLVLNYNGAAVVYYILR